MSSIYAVSTSSGSMTYNSDVSTQIRGPLSVNKCPNLISTSNNGAVQQVQYATPMQFYPSQTPPDYSYTGTARNEYRRTTVSDAIRQAQIDKGKTSEPLGVFHYSTRTAKPASSHMNYFAPKDSSCHIRELKRNAIGKSSINTRNSMLSTKSYQPSYTRSILQRARSGGCVAPAKKGAIANRTSTNGNICSWGISRTQQGVV